MNQFYLLPAMWEIAILLVEGERACVVPCEFVASMSFAIL